MSQDALPSRQSAETMPAAGTVLALVLPEMRSGFSRMKFAATSKPPSRAPRLPYKQIELPGTVDEHQVGFVTKASLLELICDAVQPADTGDNAGWDEQYDPDDLRQHLVRAASTLGATIILDMCGEGPTDNELRAITQDSGMTMSVPFSYNTPILQIDSVQTYAVRIARSERCSVGSVVHIPDGFARPAHVFTGSIQMPGSMSVGQSVLLETISNGPPY